MKLRSPRSLSAAKLTLLLGGFAAAAVQAVRWFVVFRVSGVADAATVFLAGLALSVAVWFGTIQGAAAFIQYEQFRIQFEQFRIQVDGSRIEFEARRITDEQSVGLGSCWTPELRHDDGLSALAGVVLGDEADALEKRMAGEQNLVPNFVPTEEDPNCTQPFRRGLKSRA